MQVDLLFNFIFVSKPKATYLIFAPFPINICFSHTMLPSTSFSSSFDTSIQVIKKAANKSFQQLWCSVVSMFFFNVRKVESSYFFQTEVLCSKIIIKYCDSPQALIVCSHFKKGSSTKVLLLLSPHFPFNRLTQCESQRDDETERRPFQPLSPNTP